jgi:hypothetical protein
VERVCPGQYLGFASVWIVVATILAKFNISPAPDKDGKDIIPEIEFTIGITWYDLKLLRGYTYVIMANMANNNDINKANAFALF